jgi:hypothetical protein
MLVIINTFYPYRFISGNVYSSTVMLSVAGIISALPLTTIFLFWFITSVETVARFFS